jgi:N-acetyl-alpha-D-muramate 1-phosphate uridylyltransferase
MSLPVAILAGGLATRLRPITEKIPKALVDVAGKPFVMHQLEYLKKQKVAHVVLCLGYLGEQVEAVVGNGSSFGLDVQYSWDGPTLLGTGGCLKKALPLLGEHFFIYYGDSYLPIDFQAVAHDFLACNKPGLMTVLRNNNQWDKSNIIFQNNVIIEYNKQTPNRKMLYIDYGLSVLSAAVLSEQPDKKPFDLAGIFHKLSVQGLLAGHEVYERFYEIGSHAGLEETIKHFEGEI